MSAWHIFLSIVLFLICCSYAVLTLIAQDFESSTIEELTFEQHEKFIRSMKNSAKSFTLWRGWLAVVATVIFAIFNSRPLFNGSQSLFIILAMFCASLAAFSFYRYHQI